MNGTEERVTIVDLRIPFFRLVFFFVKAALAAIPAAIILFVLLMLGTAVLAAILGAGNFDFSLRRWSM